VVKGKGKGKAIPVQAWTGQWFPTFCHLRTPWQPISINCTLHICKMFVINIDAVISNLYVDVCAFFRHYSIFFAYP
jgi:hypothetical protein